MPIFFSGNHIDLLVTGQEYFPSLLAAIEQAQSEIYLETYIFHDDATGLRVAEALAAAAQRGVTVRVTVDGFGSNNLVPQLRTILKDADVEILVFRPERRFLGRNWSLSPRRIRRLHRKLVMIDRQTAFVGGINVLDDFVDHKGHILQAPRFDFAVKIQGPLVATISVVMLNQWLRLNWRALLKADMGFGRSVARWWLHGAWRTPYSGGVEASFVRRDNFRNRTSIERTYLRAIGRARHDLIISNAYFFPGRRFRKALFHAASRGVRVRLLLQGLVEYPLQYRASQSLYDDLLRAGIEIYEYQPSLLHAKVAVMDNDWATVGSSNLDPFSLLLAREANVVVRGHSFNARLRQALELAIEKDAQAILPQRMARRPWHQRVYNWFAYGLLRLGVLLTGQAGRY
jgi:cardiolipin synthase